MSDEGTISYVASPTCAEFHADPNFVRAILGPVGSGKSVAACMEMLRLGMDQHVYNGVRSFRGLVIRGTYAQLRSTTIPTVDRWIGALGEFTYNSPIEFHARRTLPDGTILDFTLWFLALDRPEDAKKLRSLEVSACWINEFTDIPIEILHVVKGRVPRYPAVQDGGNKRPCIIMESNYPSTASPYYHLLEVERPRGHRLFKQPGGLIPNPQYTGDDDEQNEKYLPNPDAENVRWLEGGYKYYYDLTNGVSQDYINVYVLARYGATYSGKAVFANEWDDRAHVSNDIIKPSRSSPLIVGLDFGIHPAAAVVQVSPTGTLMVLDELSPDECTFDDFVSGHLAPLLGRKYAGYSVMCIGDPAGYARNVMTKMTVFEMLRARGVSAIAAPSNDFLPRRDAVAYFLTRKNGFLLSPNCAVIRNGMNGGYRFKKQTNETFAEKPDKTAESHASEALQYACLHIHKSLVRSAKQRQRPTQPAPRQYRYA